MQPRYTPADPNDVLLGWFNRYDLYTTREKRHLILRFGNLEDDELTLMLRGDDTWESIVKRHKGSRIMKQMTAFKACWDALHGLNDPSVSPACRAEIK